MTQKKRYFPLIADDEAVMQRPRQMKLYDNQELISYLAQSPQGQQARSSETSHQPAPVLVRRSIESQAQPKRSELAGKSLVQEPLGQPVSGQAAPAISQEPKASDKPALSLSEQARQEAKADIKKKRQALANLEPPHHGRPQAQPVKGERGKDKASGWSRYAQMLRQDDYILAEIAPTYRQPQNPSTKAVKKNNYDFLKRSQIYNHKDRQVQHERKIAQELNLSRFEDLD